MREPRTRRLEGLSSDPGENDSPTATKMRCTDGPLTLSHLNHRNNGDSRRLYSRRRPSLYGYRAESFLRPSSSQRQLPRLPQAHLLYLPRLSSHKAKSQAHGLCPRQHPNGSRINEKNHFSNENRLNLVQANLKSKVSGKPRPDERKS